MEGVNPTSSTATLFTNDRTTQTRNPDEQNPNPLTPPAQPPQDAPRVNEGPSTITSISPQAQRLAQQEQDAGNQGASPSDNSSNNTSPPPRNEAAPPERDDELPANPPAEPSNTAQASDQSGRAFDDRSPNSFLRN